METLHSRLQLRHVRLIHAIAETGQLSIAAERLSITQPAASRTLAEIERVLGAALFDRQPKGMVPTDLGRVLIRHAAAIIGEFDSTLHDLDAFRSGRAGAVWIGAVTGPAVSLVVPAIQRLKRDSPMAEIQVDVAPSVDLLAGLVRGDYDFVLARRPPDVDARQLSITPGKVEEIRILARADHPLLHRTGLRLVDLAELEWVIQSAGMPIREAVEQAFTNRTIAVPENTVNTASLLLTLSYLHTSDAIAAVTKEVVELLRATGTGGWATVDLRDEIVLSPYHMMRLKDRTMSPICARLEALLAADLST